MEIVKNHISVLIPVFNKEKTVGKSIESVLCQTYKDWELLLFLDGSEDNSLAIANKYKSKKVKIFHSTENIGIAAARNRLIVEAKGEYIAFLDADDFMLPTRLEVQFNYLKSNPGIDVCGTAALLRNYTIKERLYFKNHDLIQAFQFFKCGVLFPTVMTRNFYSNRELFFKEEFGSRASDFEWLYRVGLTKTLCNIPVALTSYYVSTEKELEAKKTDHNYDTKAISLLRTKCETLINRDVSYETLSLLHSFLLSNYSISLTNAQIILELLLDLLKANNFKKIHHIGSFKAIILYQVMRLKRNSKVKGYGYVWLLSKFGIGSFVRVSRFHGYFR